MRAEPEGLTRRIVLYNDRSSTSLKIKEIAEFLRDLLPSFEVVVREDPFTHYRGRYDQEKTARRLATVRVVDVMTGALNRTPLAPEIEYELRRVLDPGLKCHGVLYDGYELMELIADMIPVEERNRRTLHVVFTGRLVGTKELGEDRVHARVVILGNPTIVSTVGAVEAPARPREYYLALTLYRNPLIQQAAVSASKSAGGWDWLEHDDPRLTDVMKGYVLQAVFYYFLGEAFCDDPDCRLYNAHLQSELIRSQLLSGRLCGKHERMLRNLLR